MSTVTVGLGIVYKMCPKCGGVLYAAKEGQTEHIRCPKIPVTIEDGELVFGKRW